MEELDVRGAKGSVEKLPSGTGEIVVKLTGEIDISNVDELGAAVDRLLTGTPQRLVFELSDLQFLDSSGLALLLRATSRATSSELRRPTRIVRRAIAAAGLQDILQVVE
jgi:anti-anti-sigma factor